MRPNASKRSQMRTEPEPEPEMPCVRMTRTGVSVRSRACGHPLTSARSCAFSEMQSPASFWPRRGLSIFDLEPCEPVSVMDNLERMAPPAWERLPGDMEGIPLWKRHGEACYVATRDMDQLRIIDEALTKYDRINQDESRNFVRGRPAVDATRSKTHRVLGTPPSTLDPTTSGRNPAATPKSSYAVYIEIAAALRDRIRAHGLKPGDRLPSEAEISAEFSISRGTTRKALKQLENDGMIDALPGVGRIVHSTKQTDRIPLYRRIATELIAAIEAGDYPPGSQLPSETQLAEQYKAPRNTVRSGLSELDDRGLIEVVHGKGRIVLARTTDT